MAFRWSNSWQAVAIAVVKGDGKRMRFIAQNRDLPNLRRHKLDAAFGAVNILQLTFRNETTINGVPTDPHEQYTIFTSL